MFLHFTKIDRLEVVHKYETAMVLDDCSKDGVSVAPLVKVVGFWTVFRPNLEKEVITRVPKEEMFRFSHWVPHHMLTSQEAQSGPEGCLELGPAATTLELLQNVPETNESQGDNGSNENGHPELNMSDTSSMFTSHHNHYDILWHNWHYLQEIYEDGRLSCGYSSFRGKRASMEDFFDIKASKIGQAVCLFGIFDGHGGSRAAEFLKKHLFENLMKHPEFIANTKLAISDTYQRTDRDFLESEKDTFRDDGSTASTAVLVGNHLYIANVGDSRTIMSKAGKAIALSEDHKPNRSDERKRIENAGGVVMWAGTWRVGGVLAMSRAFGNRMLKQFVVAEPEIQEQEVDQDLELLVLASDGLWDVVANKDAVSIAQTVEEPEAAARKLSGAAFTRDNITCIVVKFRLEKVGPEETQQLEPESNPLPEPEHEAEETQQDTKAVSEESLENSITEPEKSQKIPEWSLRRPKKVSEYAGKAV
ncbi:hypothetical protein BUALT_Bualt01G0078600 [Buddleja alternifolia]|uniref:protein-serine/threonine phosphatase n=1 Tax=Buddleja alternifolia TaxID=168488 RepID=A0AAV6YDV1_9LAMI|nr:hypothetical protein BUALT_Bualt01G0078600 [Buddleja alternifolia]